MSSSRLVGWGGISAVVAEAMYALQAIIVLFTPPRLVFSSFSDYLNALVFVVALVGTLLAVLGLHALQRGAYGRLGAAGAYAALTGTAFMLLGTLVNVFFGRQVLGGLFGVGLLAALVGFALLGATTLQARRLPPWCGVLLIVGFPVSVALADRGGGIVLGVVWVLVGYALLSSEAGRI